MRQRLDAAHIPLTCGFAGMHDAVRRSGVGCARSFPPLDLTPADDMPRRTLCRPACTACAASDVRTLPLSALGGALEFYDFVVFVFFAMPLSHLFFPPDTAPWLAQLQVYGIFAAGYLARPLGGIVMAHYGDTLGRKRMFTLSVFLMALPTLASACCRCMRRSACWRRCCCCCCAWCRALRWVAKCRAPGCSWPSTCRPKRVGFACASLTSGLTVGILIGSLVAAGAQPATDARARLLDWGWRLPFLVGGVFGFVAVWLRRWLSETPVFEAMHARTRAGQRACR